MKLHFHNKIVERTFCLLFGAFCFLVFIERGCTIFQVETLGENRGKIPFPTGNLMKNIFSSFGRDSALYDDYFNDNSSLRNFFIRLKNQIDLSVFGTSDKVLIGRDGFLSRISGIVDDELVWEEGGTSKVKKTIRSFETFSLFLNNHGIHLVVAPIPNKTKIYPDKFPVSLLSDSTVTNLALFLSQIKLNRRIDYFDVTQTLLKHNKEKLFFKTDIHWTDLGATFVAKNLLNHLSHSINSKVEWNHQLLLGKGPGGYSGTDASALPLLFGLAEGNRFAVEPTWTNCGEISFQPLAIKGKHSHYVKNNNCQRTVLPPLIIIGDSFSDRFFQLGFFEYFDEVWRFHTNDLSPIPPHAPRTQHPVKVFIIVVYENNLGKAFTDDWWQSVMNIAVHFSKR